MKYHHGNLREELIRCASNLCHQYGYEKISLRSIAKEANVSQTAPYRHFETKESLLAAVATNGFIDMEESINNVIDFSKSKTISEKTLMMGMMTYLNFAEKNNNIYEIMFGTVIKDFEAYPELHQAAMRCYGTLKRALRGYVTLKDNNEYDRKCIKVWAFLHGLVGLNKIEQKLEGKELNVNTEDNAISALRSAKSNFNIFMTTAINGLIKN